MHLSINDKERIINATAMHYCIFQVKAELDQLVQGLNVLKLGQLIEENPQRLRELFVYLHPSSLTSDGLFEMFPAIFSPVGSNVREAEEEALMKWVNYTQEIEGKLVFKS